MCGRIAFEQYPKSGMIGRSLCITPHLADQLPYQIILEELTQYVDHLVEGLDGVIEVRVLGYPIEELQCALPVVIVAGDGVENCALIEIGGGGLEVPAPTKEGSKVEAVSNWRTDHAQHCRGYSGLGSKPQTVKRVASAMAAQVA